MERELRDPSIEKFPFPPKYYKEFDTEFKYKSPDLRILQKLDKFKTLELNIIIIINKLIIFYLLLIILL